MKSKSGFTIVELLIVIVVIGILAAITIVAYNGIQTRARNAERTAEVTAIQKALEMYKLDNSTYPAGDVNNTTAPLVAALVPKYISAIPSDPDTSIRYHYVTDVHTRYAILVFYGSDGCKRGNDTAEAYNWWGAPYCQ